jgi:lipoprotein NlpI
MMLLLRTVAEAKAVPFDYPWRPSFRLVLCGLVLWGLVGCGAGIAQEETFRIQIAKAQQALAAEKYSEAIELASAAGNMAGDVPGYLQSVGETLYRAGASKRSLEYFDRVVQLQPRSAPYNWQRGLALCSVGRFEDGAEQFKTHHDVNPDDVENSAWYFLCVAKTKGTEAARETVIPSRGDGREPMMSILKMLQGKLQPEQVVQAAIDNTSEGLRRKRALFYADLYIGLYYDSLGNSAEAERYLRRSLSRGDSGYMVDSARVYLQDRFAKNENKDSKPK